jgi:predicted Fe-Mo cluster-binding NifX family protein
MRFAVPVADGRVAPRFGHCSHFALFDVYEASTRIVRIEVVVGVMGDEPEKVVLDYLRGELAKGDNIRDH